MMSEMNDNDNCFLSSILYTDLTILDNDELDTLIYLTNR